MKTQDTRNWRIVLISVVIMLAVLFPMLGEAGPSVGKSCKTRPLSDFLDAQGTTSFFFHPVGDMLAWTDGPFINFALVDYAGLANAYIEETTGSSLGTRVSGTVIECERNDGKPLISVDLNTHNALGFAQSIQALINNDFDFLNTPTIFGAKAQDVVAGAEPALGPAHFRMTFVIDHPGADLPDIRPAFQENEPDVRPITLDFRSTTVGTLPDGTRARLRIQEVAATDENGDLIFTREIVDISGDNGD